MRKFDEPRLVHLRWADSCNLFQDRWASMDDLDEFEAETFCETVGWLVAETDRSLFVAGSLAPCEIGSVMQIPRVAVVRELAVLSLEVEDGEVEFEGSEGASEVGVCGAGPVVSGAGQVACGEREGAGVAGGEGGPDVSGSGGSD